MKRAILFLLLSGQACPATLPHAFCGYRYQDTFTPLKMRRTEFERLLATLSDPNAPILVRADAASLLGRTGSEEALAPLARIAFGFSDAYLRVPAIRAIGQIGYQSTEISDRLIRVLREIRAPEVRAAAMMALSYRSPHLASTYLGLFPFDESQGTPEENRVAFKCLGHLDRSLASPILRDALDGSLLRASAAFDAMGKVSDPANVEKLGQKLGVSSGADNLERAAYAAVALGEMGNGNYLELIRMSLNSIRGSDPANQRLKMQFVVALVYLGVQYPNESRSGLSYSRILTNQLTLEKSAYMLYHIVNALCRIGYKPAIKEIDTHHVMRKLHSGFTDYDYVLDEYDLLKVRREVAKLRLQAAANRNSGRNGDGRAPNVMELLWGLGHQGQ